MARAKFGPVRWISDQVFNRLVPLIGGLFGNRQAYTYLPESTARFMTREELTQSMRSAGFIDVTTRDFMFGNICMHLGRKPE